MRAISIAVFAIAVGMITNAGDAAMIISGNFGNTTLDSTDLTGVVPADNWNNWFNQGSGTNEAVVDSDGNTVTGVTVSWNANNALNGQTGSSSDPTNELFDGRLHSGSGSGSVSLTVNVTGGALSGGYDLYVYHWNNSADANEGHNYTVGATVKYTKGPHGGSTDVTSFLEGADTFASAVAGSNYVVFDGLLGTQTMTVDDSGASRNGISGFQIVEIEVIPEPTTFFLMTLAGMAVFMRRRPNRA